MFQIVLIWAWEIHPSSAAAGNGCWQDRLLSQTSGELGNDCCALQSLLNVGDGDKHTHLGSWLPLFTLVTL